MHKNPRNVFLPHYCLTKKGSFTASSQKKKNPLKSISSPSPPPFKEFQVRHKFRKRENKKKMVGKEDI
jgi:hypothetical protein